MKRGWVKTSCPLGKSFTGNVREVFPSPPLLFGFLSLITLQILRIIIVVRRGGGRKASIHWGIGSCVCLQITVLRIVKPNYIGFCESTCILFYVLMENLKKGTFAENYFLALTSRKHGIMTTFYLTVAK